MKKVNKILSVLLSLIMIFSVIPMTSTTASAAAPGVCGDNVTWSFNEFTGILTISGTGAMYDYGYEDQQWAIYKNDIMKIVINDGVTSIGNNAFTECINLISVMLPDSITSIGNYAFRNCTSLESIKIPNGVQSIRCGAFSYCIGLTSVIIPDSVTTIDSEAFSFCESLESVSIPYGVKTIGEFAFFDCDSLTKIKVDSNNQYFSNDNTGVLFNKDKTKLIQYPIGYMGTAYEIPDSVTEIGDFAFSQCKNLVFLTIPDSVTVISDYAFNNSYSLAEITVDDNNQYYSSDEYGVLFDKNKTILLQYPIGNAQTSYIVPDGVLWIGHNALESCDSVVNVIIPDTVVSIEYCAFYSCDNLSTITIPNSVTTIGESALYGCEGLTDVYYSGTEEQWNDINIGSDNECLTNANIHFDSTTDVIDGVCGDNETWSLDIETGTLIVLEDYLEEFFPSEEDSPWYEYSEYIKNVIISDGVTAINTYAFYSCENLISVTIPDSVKTISDYAFANCNSIADVYYSGTEEEWDKISICSDNNQLLNATLHFDYVKNEPWQVGDIIEFGSYPQSEVTDSSLVSALNSLTKIWTSYGYYSGTGDWDDGQMTSDDYMKYADVTYSGNKYRAVRFTEYRPCRTGYENVDGTYQDDNGYYTNTVYWFKYEPLKWRVLDPDEGFIMCESIIDAQPYNNTIFYNRTDYEYYHADSKICANDYASSSIREWLNDDFYNIAFTSGEKSEIRKSTLDNSGYSSIYSQHNSETTYDKIFLLSFNEVINNKYGFYPSEHTNDTNRQTGGSDYAKSQGLNVNDSDISAYYGNSEWWLRSAGNLSGDSCSVQSAGDISGPSIPTTYIDVTCVGIRPALKLNSESEIPNPGTTESDKYIGVFTTERSMTIEKGEFLSLGFALIENGKIDDKWREMAITVSDPSIVSVGEYEKAENGAVIDFKGLNYGSTNVTVTDTETGTNTDFVITVKARYAGTYTFEIDDMIEFYPQDGLNNKVLTNFNANDMYVNNYKCEKDGNNYNVTFDVYNHNYFMGAVDIYDANGEWINSYQIDKFEEPDGAKDAFEKVYHAIVNVVDGSWLTYQSATQAQHTKVKISVPDGGYFTVSNNISKSPGTMMFNGVEFVLSAGIAAAKHSFKGFVENETKNNNFKNTIIGQIVNKPENRKKCVEILTSELFSERLGDLKDSVTLLNYKNASQEFTNLFESILSELHFDWKDYFDLSYGLYEEVVKEFGGTAGQLLEAYSKGAELVNIYKKITGICKSVDMPYVTVDSQIEEGHVNDKGIFVNTKGNIDIETVLQVFHINKDEKSENLANGKDYETYNISFVKNDKTVQPSGTVEVRIPVPKGMKKDTCIIYRQEENGEWTALNAWIEGDYLVFETDHFSLYTIIGENYELAIDTLPDKLIYTQGEYIDLSGMILEINDELISDSFIATPYLMTDIGVQTITVYYESMTVEFEVEVEPKSNEEENPSADGHDFYYGFCTVCGESDIIESSHPYDDDTDETYVIYKEYASFIYIRFSRDTYVEENYDFIEIYDMDDNLVGRYTGDELASEQITVDGDTAIIRLVSDSSNTGYGFTINDMGYMIIPSTDAGYEFYIQQPSITTIRNKDAINLHAVVDGDAPEGSYIEWESSNKNFSLGRYIGDDKRVLATAENKGYTTFTATLYDADGTALATKSVELYSKSGFFDKIGGFFRMLFGATKTYYN